MLQMGRKLSISFLWKKFVQYRSPSIVDDRHVLRLSIILTVNPGEYLDPTVLNFSKISTKSQNTNFPFK